MPTKEKFRTFEAVFDQFTLRNLFKLGSFFDYEEMIPISVGKEANVFAAPSKKDKNSFVAIKIYRLETCDFNRMYDYIKSDPRYHNLKDKRREVVFAWAQREYRNLFAAREAHMKAPTPIHFLKNILVMEFIGDEHPAPKLKDAIPKNKKKFFDEIIKSIKNFYKAGFVHGDLSQFNILNYKDKPVFIDFSQATTLKNFNSEEWLARDIKNICDFFKKAGLKVSQEQVLKKIKR